MSVASINGVDLYYEVHGSGEPLFLTHGSWGDATAWADVVPGLAREFEVVIWDRRGHSRSAEGDGSGSLVEDAEDLAGLIDHLGRREAHVYGSSSGGTVTLTMAASHPEMVLSAAVHEPAVPDLVEGSSEQAIVDAMADQKRHLDETRRLIESGRSAEGAEYFFDNVAVGPGAWSRYPEFVRSAFAANAGTYAGELANRDSWMVDPAALETSRFPLMITIGTESPFLIRVSTQALIDLIPSALVETFAGLGHVPYRTDPDLWVRTLTSFCRGVSSDRSMR